MAGLRSRVADRPTRRLLAAQRRTRARFATLSIVLVVLGAAVAACGGLQAPAGVQRQTAACVQPMPAIPSYETTGPFPWQFKTDVLTASAFDPSTDIGAWNTQFNIATSSPIRLVAVSATGIPHVPTPRIVSAFVLTNPTQARQGSAITKGRAAELPRLHGFVVRPHEDPLLILRLAPPACAMTGSHPLGYARNDDYVLWYQPLGRTALHAGYIPFSDLICVKGIAPAGCLIPGRVHAFPKIGTVTFPPPTS